MPLAAAAVLLASLAGCAPQSTLSQVAPTADASNTLILELKSGMVTIVLRPDLAPQHVERVKLLAREGFYNGLKFHRVIERFMAQSGDPTGTGTGGSKYPNLPAEFSKLSFDRGTVAAARTSDPNSANSQFFICFTEGGCASLTGKYTIWGKVTSGMEFVDGIARGEPPANPDIIVRMYIASDGPGPAPATQPPAKKK